MGDALSVKHQRTFGRNAMKLIVRLAVLVVVVTLSLASPPRSHAGAAATPTAKNCFFVRNHLPCPCPSGQQARAVGRAARVTVRALGTAIGTTAVALTRADRNHGVPADSRHASHSTQPPKR
jgi:hypothetical protein